MALDAVRASSTRSAPAALPQVMRTVASVGDQATSSTAPGAGAHSTSTAHAPLGSRRSADTLPSFAPQARQASSRHCRPKPSAGRCATASGPRCMTPAGRGPAAQSRSHSGRASQTSTAPRSDHVATSPGARSQAATRLTPPGCPKATWSAVASACRSSSSSPSSSDSSSSESCSRRPRPSSFSSVSRFASPTACVPHAASSACGNRVRPPPPASRTKSKDRQGQSLPRRWSMR
mmetsp:Transcript_2133/g.6921  ORF Transcript_2133/g.6921 Transcript_2133/m.6921 type:complete len:234 (+) Transcript_2133:461-1162(+)